MLVVMMPVAGFLVSKVQPRWLIAAGFSLVAASMVLSRGLTLGIDMRYVIMTRLVFSLGGPLIFIPINVAAYAFVPKGKNNSASGLINLARNLGASFGIAGLGTMIERRAQFHQTVLVSHLTPFDAAARAPLAGLYGLVQQQAALLSYADGFQILALGSMLVVPLVLLLKDVQAGQAEVPVH
jgi:DHA2 family multidrug resistance protein